MGFGAAASPPNEKLAPSAVGAATFGMAGLAAGLAGLGLAGLGLVGADACGAAAGAGDGLAIAAGLAGDRAPPSWIELGLGLGLGSGLGVKGWGLGFHRCWQRTINQRKL